MKRIFSFELFFVLFLFAGRFKSDERFSWVPIDITLLFLINSILIGLYLFAFRKVKITKLTFHYFILYLVFVSFSLYSLYWTSSNVYAYEKLFHLFITVLWSVAGGLIISHERERIIRFLFMMFAFSSWIAVESLIYLQESHSGFINVLGGNYLGIGRVLGIGFILLLSFLIFKHKSGTMKIGVTIVAILYLYLLLNTGGRGPFIATLCSLPLLTLYYIEIKNREILIKKKMLLFIITLFVSIIASIYYFISAKDQQTIKRLMVLFDDDYKGASAETRIYFIENSIALIKEKFFFGYGIGSWPVEMGLGDERGYPHNLFIEIQFELGVIGLVFVMALFFKAVSNGLKNMKSDSIYIILLTLFISMLFNSMISGDISDNRLLFTFLALLLYRAHPKTIKRI
ncbi:O-antigen ligase family protein [Sporosarcina sp. 179-K 8C2 HS]|uniref:O-antigen ligase family protein n=1 Tax=Sporosarcina sp. 179-K 8C2 HS TaxID=3142387 RepID=UPI0039A04EB5